MKFSYNPNKHIQPDRDTCCGELFCNALCTVRPSDSPFDFDVHCPDHGWTKIISWTRELPPPTFTVQKIAQAELFPLNW